MDKLFGCVREGEYRYRKREGKSRLKHGGSLECFYVTGSRFPGKYVILPQLLATVSTNKERYGGAGLWVKD